MGHTPSYYAATVASGNEYPVLANNIEVETCIVGAGFAGLSTALGLVERGHRNIVVIDAENIGFGCSGRNGGFVFGGYSLPEDGLVKAVGRKKAKDLYHLTIAGIELIRKRIKSLQIDCDIVESGVLLCNWFKNERILSNYQQFMDKNMGVKLDYMPPEQLRKIVKSERYSGALVEKNAFHFHPLKYALGLANELRNTGIQLYANSPVLRIETTGATKIIHTKNGHVRAKQIVVCCGGYLNGLYKPLQRASLPIGTYVMVTEKLGKRRNEAFTCNHAIYDTRFAFDYYRPLVDGRIMWGGRVSTNPAKPPNIKELLYRDMLKVYPQLEGVKIEYAWQGLMSWSRHKMPQIGQERLGVWYAQAFGGHGVAATNIAGELLAAAIVESDDTIAELSDLFGLTSVFGPLGRIGAELIYQWYKIKPKLW